MTIGRPSNYLLAAVFSAVAFAQQTPSNATVYATGLEGPRGLRFGPDGHLYVAEAGTGGTTSTTDADCEQTPPPVGPYKGGTSTGRISKISSSGKVTTVASGFPSSSDGLGDNQGVADVVFVDNELYALISGGGCSHGNPKSPNGIAKVNRNDGSWKLLANLSAFLKTHPAKYESVDDFEPDGTPYSVIQVHGTMYLIEPNRGEIISVSRTGHMSEVLDVSASQGHIVPTSIAERDGSFFVGNLNLFPIDPQWARILTISNGDRDDDYDTPPGFRQPRGYRITASKAGFTTVVGVDFGPDGLLYVLELSDAAGMGPTPGKGKVVRVKHSGEIEEVVTGLVVPTGMTFGPDGDLYISNFGAAPAGGQILKVDVPPVW